jgi:integrase
LAELEAITVSLPERYRLMVLLASRCAMRFGELIELRRSDIDLKAGKLMIRRAAVVVDGQTIVGSPKSSAGVRDVAIPPHLLPAVREHLATFAEWGKAGLLSPVLVAITWITVGFSGVGIGRVRLLGGPICVSMIFGTLEQCWRLKRATRWPS